MENVFFLSEEYQETRRAAKRGLGTAYHPQSLATLLRKNVSSLWDACEFIGFCVVYGNNISKGLSTYWMAQRQGAELGEFLLCRIRDFIEQYGITYSAITDKECEARYFVFPFDVTECDIFSMFQDETVDNPVLSEIVVEESFDDDQEERVGTPFLVLAGLECEASIYMDVQIALLADTRSVRVLEVETYKLVKEEFSLIIENSIKGKKIMLKDFQKSINSGYSENEGIKAFNKLFTPSRIARVLGEAKGKSHFFFSHEGILNSETSASRYLFASYALFAQAMRREEEDRFAVLANIVISFLADCEYGGDDDFFDCFDKIDDVAVCTYAYNNLKDLRFSAHLMEYSTAKILSVWRKNMGNNEVWNSLVKELMGHDFQRVFSEVHHLKTPKVHAARLLGDLDDFDRKKKRLKRVLAELVKGTDVLVISPDDIVVKLSENNVDEIASWEFDWSFPRAWAKTGSLPYRIFVREVSFNVVTCVQMEIKRDVEKREEGGASAQRRYESSPFFVDETWFDRDYDEIDSESSCVEDSSSDEVDRCVVDPQPPWMLCATDIVTQKYYQADFWTQPTVADYRFSLHQKYGKWFDTIIFGGSSLPDDYELDKYEKLHVAAYWKEPLKIVCRNAWTGVLSDVEFSYEPRVSDLRKALREKYPGENVTLYIRDIRLGDDEEVLDVMKREKADLLDVVLFE